MLNFTIKAELFYKGGGGMELNDFRNAYLQLSFTTLLATFYISVLLVTEII